jgi:hypothetical protein
MWDSSSGRSANICSMYVVCDPACPHIALDVADSLSVIAAALLARSEPNLTVYVNRDGLGSDLDGAEQRELDELLRIARASAWAGAEPTPLHFAGLKRGDRRS